jgi:hypothetical protein
VLIIDVMVGAGPPVEMAMGTRDPIPDEYLLY